MKKIFVTAALIGGCYLVGSIILRVLSLANRVA